jgi:hypothetical protein
MSHDSDGVQVTRQPPMSEFDAVMICEGAQEPESEEQLLEAWQLLVDTGLAFRLQGWFGRRAAEMIRAGVLQPPRSKRERGAV